MKAKVGIVNRFSNGDYKLGELLAKDHNVVKLDLSGFSIEDEVVLYEGEELYDIDVIVWRLSENLYPAVKPILTELQTEYHDRLLNSSLGLGRCADKKSTANNLKFHKLPFVEIDVTFPSSIVEEGKVAKPRFGAGGRDIIFGPGVVPADSTEPWVEQEYVGDSDNHVRVLMVGDTPITAYNRVSTTFVNNIENGGKRVFLSDYDEYSKLAKKVMKKLGLDVAGIDFTSDGRVLEINGSPGVPPEYLESFAAELSRVIQNKMWDYNFL